jgi:alpha-L-fucosidase
MTVSASSTPKARTTNVVKATPYGKDLLKPLANECRKQGIRFCTYYSIMDWHHRPSFAPAKGLQSDAHPSGA